jgi:hypothetical protein
VSGSQKKGVEMTVTPERTAELLALLEQVLGLTPGPPSKPKVVVNETLVVRDADVRVGPADPNYPKSDDGVVKVRRSDWVTVRVDLWEEQQRQRREERRRRRELDPFRLGHWGSVDDEDE